MLLFSNKQKLPQSMTTDCDSPTKGSGSVSEDDTRSRFSLYLHQLAGHTDDCISIVDMEHSYSRPWNWRPYNNHVKPKKTLFVSRCMAERMQGDVVDAEGSTMHPIPPYDPVKARIVMEECERLVSYVRQIDEKSDDWEELIDKTGWTATELRLFNKVVRILQSDRLARLAHKGNWNEPVLRRITVDKSARRFRQALALVDWESETTQWLHCLLMENLSSTYLAAYFDILQTLKSKIPQLVERMTSVPPSQLGRSGLAVADTLNQLMKRAWDPVNPSCSTHRTRKLPGDPILVVVPYCPGNGFPSNSRPYHWLAYLSNLGTLITVITPPGIINSRMSTSSCLEQMVSATRAKIAELRSDYSGRPIILVGLSCGAALACQVALVENVTAVVCLAFPLYSVDDKRGQPDDAILDLQVPVLFIVGQNASLSTVEEMEDLRAHMKAETGLIEVGGADDQLRISKAKKKAEGVTQSMVDWCILDEVGDFLGNILMQSYMSPPSTRQPLTARSTYNTEQRRGFNNRFFERKRKVDSKADSDVPRVPAKRGRKPKALSMIQQKPLDPKWNTVTATTQPHPTSHQHTQPIVSMSGTSIVSGVTSSGTVIGTSSGTNTGTVVCKPMVTPLTGLRLTPTSTSDGKGNMHELKTVQLSIQGGIVRQTTVPMSSASEGNITVVASAPVTSGIVSASPTVIQHTNTSCTPQSMSKDIVIQVPGTAKSRLPITATHSQLTSLSSLLQPTPTIVLSPSKSREVAVHRVSAADQASLVEELTPDRILELPVIFEDQQPEEHQPSDSSTVKVILSNNSSLTKKHQPTKPSIPAIKYVKKGQAQQGVKYTKIFLRKKDEKDTGPTSVFVEEVDEGDLAASRGTRIRHIPATQHSQFC